MVQEDTFHMHMFTLWEWRWFIVQCPKYARREQIHSDLLLTITQCNASSRIFACVWQLTCMCILMFRINNWWMQGMNNQLEFCINACRDAQIMWSLSHTVEHGVDFYCMGEEWCYFFSTPSMCGGSFRLRSGSPVGIHHIYSTYHVPPLETPEHLLIMQLSSQPMMWQQSDAWNPVSHIFCILMAAAWSDGNAYFYIIPRKPDSSAHFFIYGFSREVELQALEWTLDRSLILTSSFNGVSFCHHHILYFKYILLHLTVGFYCVKYKFVQYHAGEYCFQSMLSNKQIEKKKNLFKQLCFYVTSFFSAPPTCIQRPLEVQTSRLRATGMWQEF